MKRVDDGPEPQPSFLHLHPVLVEEHMDDISLARAFEAEVEIAAVIAAGLPRHDPSDKAESVTDRRRKRRVIFRIDNLQRAFPFYSFIPGFAELMVKIQRADAEDEQIARAQETGVDVYLEKETAHAL